MTKDIVTNIIASIIFVVLSTIIGLLLQAVGLSIQESAKVGLIALVVLLLLFFLVRAVYPRLRRVLTEQLLERALGVDAGNADNAAVELKKRIIERVRQEGFLAEANRNNGFTEFPNQEACETFIHEAFRNAKVTKILTVRGEKYFLGDKSLLRELCLLKQGIGFAINVLVLSTESQHLTEQLAKDLGEESKEVVQLKISIVLDKGLKALASRNPNFHVRCYKETPVFKILLFDKVMFMSPILTRKNDENVRMYQISEDHPLFKGFEKYFDELWKRSPDL